MFSFGYSNDMYRFTVYIGKEGRQELRQLQFSWEYNHPNKYTSKLGDYINLQRLYIGLNRINIEHLSLREDPDIWKWKGYSEHTLKLLHQLPRSVELKIREVTPNNKNISYFFEGDQTTRQLIYPAELEVIYSDESFEFKEGIVEEFEARVKERLKEYDMPKVEEVLGRRRNAAIVGEKKRQAARME